MTFQLSRLSAREQQILAFACDGLTTEQIADQLQLSVEAAQSGMDGISQKMGLRDCAALIAFARKHGLCRQSDQTNS